MTTTNGPRAIQECASYKAAYDLVQTWRKAVDTGIMEARAHHKLCEIIALGLANQRLLTVRAMQEAARRTPLCISTATPLSSGLTMTAKGFDLPQEIVDAGLGAVEPISPKKELSPFWCECFRKETLLPSFWWRRIKTAVMHDQAFMDSLAYCPDCGKPRVTA